MGRADCEEENWDFLDEGSDDDDDDALEDLPKGDAEIQEEAPITSATEAEALDMLHDLFRTCIGKRTTTDLISILFDPTVPFRLQPRHSRKYLEHLEAGEPAQLNDRRLRVPSAYKSGERKSDGGSSADSVAELCVIRMAMAALFSRAAYSALTRQGAGDSSTAFLGNAAKSTCGQFTDAEHLEAFIELSGSRREDVILSSWQAKTFEPAFVVFWVHSLKWLVVTVRGTSGWESLLTDVAAQTQEIVGGLAHSGAVRAARWVLKSMRNIVISALRSQPEYELICTGHSMGGDVAAILALFLRTGEADIPVETLNGFLESVELPIEPPTSPPLSTPSNGYRKANIDPLGGILISSSSNVAPAHVKSIATEVEPPSEATQIQTQMPSSSNSTMGHVERGVVALGQRVRAYAFGASPVMSPSLAEQCCSFCISVSRNMDFVTRLSVLTTDMLILELTRESRPKRAQQWLKEKLGSRTSDPGERVFGSEAAVADILVPPGMLLHVDRLHHEGVNLNWPLPDFYQSLLIHDSMFSDHLPLHYVEDLLTLLRFLAPRYSGMLRLADDAAECRAEAPRRVRAGLEDLLSPTRQSSHTRRTNSEELLASEWAELEGSMRDKK